MEITDFEEEAVWETDPYAEEFSPEQLQEVSVEHDMIDGSEYFGHVARLVELMYHAKLGHPIAPIKINF